MNGAETKMIISSNARMAQRLIAACAIAAAAGGGMRLLAAPADNIRLVGVSSQAVGKTAAVLIEATQPVAYSVSRPDPLTVLVDLQNVTVGAAGATVTKTAPIANVTVEQATATGGQSLARVRVALTAPAVYKVHSDRNVIHLDLDPGKTEEGRKKTEEGRNAESSTAAALMAPSLAPGVLRHDDATTAPAATKLEEGARVAFGDGDDSDAGGQRTPHAFVADGIRQSTAPPRYSISRTCRPPRPRGRRWTART